MINLLISLAAGIVVFGVIGAASSWGIAAFPGLAVMVTVYILLARRTNKQLEAGMPDVQKALMARKPEEAVKQLQRLRELGRWQFLVGPAIDSQIGMVIYAHQQDPDAAQPYLEKSSVRQWQAKAMLAAVHYRRKDYEKMEEVFEAAVRASKKAGLLWSAYAWCEWKRGKKEHAIEILGRGLKALDDDERLKANLLNLQNGRKMKMKAYAEEWWALLLERPPVQMVAPGGKPARGGRVRQKRGGRRR